MLHILVIEDGSNVSNLLQKCAQKTHSDLKITYRFSGRAALEEITHHHFPDIIVMDINLVNISPLEVISQLKQKYPEIKILMQIEREDINLIISTIEAGASGYFISSQTPINDIVNIIEIVYDDGALMTQNVATNILHKFDTGIPIPVNTETDNNNFNLTDKEKELLKDLAEGLLYKDIAAKHNISIPTVNHHIRNIYKKMHVKSRAQAVAISMRNNKDSSKE